MSRNAFTAATIGGISAIIIVGATSFLADNPESDPFGQSEYEEMIVDFSDEDFQALEALAEASCTCMRDGGNEDGCWARYRSLTEEHLLASAATACAPISTELDCFATAEGERCIVTGYNVNGASPEDRDVMVCNEAEARAIEAAANNPFHPDGEAIADDEAAWARAITESDRNVDDVMDRIRRGEDFPDLSPASTGCV